MSQSPNNATGSHLPDLDSEGGVTRLGGNRALYSQLLRQFLAKYSHIDSEIEESLKQGRNDDTIRMVHTIKGVAGNLNITALYHTASDWELALRSGAATPLVLAEHSARFKLALVGAVNAVTGFLNTTDVTPKVITVPTATVAKAIARDYSHNELADLKLKLQINDMSAALIGRELASKLAGTMAATQVSQMNAHIAKLDYPEALKSLAAVEAALKAD